jgi:hypothetical protein
MRVMDRVSMDVRMDRVRYVHCRDPMVTGADSLAGVYSRDTPPQQFIDHILRTQQGTQIIIHRTLLDFSASVSPSWKIDTWPTSWPW